MHFAASQPAAAHASSSVLKQKPLTRKLQSFGVSSPAPASASSTAGDATGVSADGVALAAAAGGSAARGAFAPSARGPDAHAAAPSNSATQEQRRAFSRCMVSLHTVVVMTLPS